MKEIVVAWISAHIFYPGYQCLVILLYDGALSFKSLEASGHYKNHVPTCRSSQRSSVRLVAYK